MAVAKVCRICVSEESNMMELYEPLSIELINKIQFCTGVLLRKEDGLPSQMCLKCLADLHIAHKFKTNCIDSESKLQKLMKSSYKDIKIEPESVNDSCIKCELYQDDFRSNSSDADIKSENGVISCGKKRVAMKNKIIIKKKPVTINVSDDPKNCRRGLNKLKLYCEQCQMTFSSRKESVDHRKRVHKEDKSWICEICGKSYVHRSSQIAHMRSHYPARYSCDYCGYSTYNKSDLIKHIRIHTGGKSYKCTQCPATYSSSSNLSSHVRLTHDRLRAHACHVCGKTYKDRATLNRHIDAHNDIKRYVCEVCHTCYAKRSYWKKHLLKQHNIVIPACRPGRPKSKILLLERTDQIERKTINKEKNKFQRQQAKILLQRTDKMEYQEGKKSS